jgi:NAD(P)-dependent dehydrogenase (short-subunit alcohol dehydrogenase family)
MNAYCQSKLAQMIFAYELQRRVAAANKNVQVQVCHPGASRTELSKEEASLFTRVLFLLLSPLAQSAEKGSWPEVLCATEEELKTETYYGPTQRAEMVGRIGECPLEPHVLEQSTATKLWTVSEEKTGLRWEW